METKMPKPNIKMALATNNGKRWVPCPEAFKKTSDFKTTPLLCNQTIRMN
jgi:hypothetical protein